MKCIRCGEAHRLESHGFCDTCFRAIEKEAAEIAENEYLARWLHSRVDAYGRFIEDSALTHTSYDKHQILRLLIQAKRQGIDWTSPPTPRGTLDIRAEVMLKYGADLPARGRPRQRSA